MNLTRKFWSYVSVDLLAYLVPIVAFLLLYLGTKNLESSVLATKFYGCPVLLVVSLGLTIGIVLGAGLTGLWDIVPRIQNTSTPREAWKSFERIVDASWCILALSFILTMVNTLPFSPQRIIEALLFWATAFIGMMGYLGAMIYCNAKRQQLGI
jgi:hypothetical protein